MKIQTFKAKHYKSPFCFLFFKIEGITIKGKKMSNLVLVQCFLQIYSVFKSMALNSIDCKQYIVSVFIFFFLPFCMLHNYKVIRALENVADAYGYVIQDFEPLSGISAVNDRK